MAWVSLNDVFVNKAGGSISGNLSVDGALTINSGKGDGSTYNVATQLTNLNNSKAAVSHTHSATDITKGTLSLDHLPTIPVSKGGTGATTASAALTNLGAASAQALKNLQDSVSQKTLLSQQVNLQGVNVLVTVKYLSCFHALTVYAKHISGYITTSKGGKWEVLVGTLTPAYCPSMSTWSTLYEDTQYLKSQAVGVLTSGKVFLYIESYNAMSNYGFDNSSGIVFL